MRRRVTARETVPPTALFERAWRALGGPELVTEYRFAPPRRFRFDYALPAIRLAVEIEGGTWRGGRHVRPATYAKDCEKYNLATALGWRVFRLTVEMVRDEPAHHLATILALVADPR